MTGRVGGFALGLLLALGAIGCERRQGIAEDDAQRAADCYAFLEGPTHDADEGSAGNPTRLRLHRAKDWRDALVPGVGRWVGGGQHRAGPPSTVFRGLGNGRRGCVFYVRNRDGSADAYFHNVSAGSMDKFTGAVRCVHTGNPHPDDVPPKWLADPGDCTRLDATVDLGGRSATVSVEPRDGRPASVEQLADSLQARLTGIGMDTTAARTALAPLLIFGPWYPCELNGCCRAW